MADFPKRFHHLPAQVGEWVLFLGSLLAATWVVTRSQEAPELILLAVLIIITYNFSLPPAWGAINLTPLVLLTSLLIVGAKTAVFQATGSLLLAELARPLWQSIWNTLEIERPSRHERVGLVLVHLLSLGIGIYIYQSSGGAAPLFRDALQMPAPFLWLTIGFAPTYLLLHLGLWLWEKRPFSQFWQQNALATLIIGLTAPAFALLGSLIFLQSGLPALILFALALTIFSIILWLNWQRQYTLARQLSQFTALNRSGASLRETLDLPTVLQRTYTLVQELVPIDRFEIVLQDKDGQWQRPFTNHETITPNWQPDDFTQWVLANGRLLDINQTNIHFAAKHNLTPPTPLPAAWLGIPLTSNEKLIGAMILQRNPPATPFSRWNREVLLAIAGQASAAIENARLYNLTDEALAQRVRQLQALLDAMEEGVLMLDKNGRILLCNPVAANLLHTPATQLLNHPLAETHLARIGYTATSLATLCQQLQSGKIPTPRHTEYDIPADTPYQKRWFIRAEAPVFTNNKQVLGWLMLFRDITEEKELAERRADLTRMIVHDLRNPLTTMASTLNLAQRHINSAVSNNVHELLMAASTSCADLLDMVDSLLDVTRMESGQLIIEAEPMRLPPLVTQVIARLQPLAHARGITLTCTCPPDLPPIWADAELVRRILINLLDNALKFTPAGGTVNGRFLPEPAPTPEHEPGIRGIIEDTGPGIPPEFRTKVFDRFMHTNPGGAQVRGTGLGLTFCKLAIEAHNGRIWVEDAPGGGSRFIFTLPGLPPIYTHPPDD